MKELLKKAVLASIGAVSLTRTKVEEVVSELVRRGELTETQGSTIVQTLVAEGEKQRDDMAHKVTEAVDAALTRLDLVRRSELQALEKRVEHLERRI